MVICGQTFDFSPLNANDIERLETANEKMQRAGESELEQFRRGHLHVQLPIRPGTLRINPLSQY